MRSPPQGLVDPLLCAVRAEAAPDAAASAGVVEPAAALYVLSRLCHSLSHRPLLTAISDALLGGGAENPHRQRILLMLAACSGGRSSAVAAMCLLQVLVSSRFSDDAALGARLLAPRASSVRAR